MSELIENPLNSTLKIELVEYEQERRISKIYLTVQNSTLAWLVGVGMSRNGQNVKNRECLRSKVNSLNYYEYFIVRSKLGIKPIAARTDAESSTSD